MLEQATGISMIQCEPMPRRRYTSYDIEEKDPTRGDIDTEGPRGDAIYMEEGLGGDAIDTEEGARGDVINTGKTWRGYM